MGALEAPIVAMLLCLCSVRAQCDAASASPSAEQEQEIQMLRSKVASLEDEISWRKEETSQLESVVRERTAQMAALVGDLELLQKVNLDDDEPVMKANTHNSMLEKQIERLGNDLEDQIRKGESLESRTIEAERSLHEFGRKLEHAEKTNSEQKKKIQELGDRLQYSQVEAERSLHEFSRKLEHAEKTNSEQKKKIQDLSDRLQYSQDKLYLSENEAKSKAEELAKARGMWLPHWLAVRVLYCQKLVPVAKGHLDALRNTTAEFTSAVANSTSTAYGVLRDVIQACPVKAGEFADNYWQPLFSRVVAASDPHLSRASVVLEPYTRPATSACRSLVSFTGECHRQVQNGVKRFLQGSQLPTPLSADKLAWITASALLALPVLCIYKIVSAFVW